MAKKKKRRTRGRKGISKDWGRKPGTEVSYTPAKIAIPAGRCPVQLKGSDADSVKEWVISLTSKKPEVYTYQPSVYRYWVRHFYDFWTDEHKEVMLNLENIVTKDIKTVEDLEG